MSNKAIQRQGVYEFHLRYWGEVEKDDWITRDLGVSERDFWFTSAADRAIFKSLLKGVADARDVVIAFAEHEGTDVRQRTIASMTMVLPDGRELQYSMDFGYGYPEESAEYMFTEGNYSCDCNLSRFLSQDGIAPDLAEFDCGETIKLKDFRVFKSSAQTQTADPLIEYAQ